jgi:hypothetical protein
LNKRKPPGSKNVPGAQQEERWPGIKPERAYFISAESLKNFNMACAAVKSISIYQGKSAWQSMVGRR